MNTLQGADQLRARLKAMKLGFKDVGRQWADETAQVARTMVPSRTGRTRSSIRRKNATQRKATVVGFYPVNFINAGAKEHDIQPRRTSVLKFKAGGDVIFRKKVHKRAQPAHPFKRRAGEEGLRRVHILDRLIERWNRAA